MLQNKAGNSNRQAPSFLLWHQAIGIWYDGVFNQRQTLQPKENTSWGSSFFFLIFLRKIVVWWLFNFKTEVLICICVAESKGWCSNWSLHAPEWRRLQGRLSQQCLPIEVASNSYYNSKVISFSFYWLSTFVRLNIWTFVLKPGSWYGMNCGLEKIVEFLFTMLLCCCWRYRIQFLFY